MAQNYTPINAKNLMTSNTEYKKRILGKSLPIYIIIKLIKTSDKNL